MLDLFVFVTDQIIVHWYSPESHLTTFYTKKIRPPAKIGHDLITKHYAKHRSICHFVQFVSLFNLSLCSICHLFNFQLCSIFHFVLFVTLLNLSFCSIRHCGWDEGVGCKKLKIIILWTMGSVLTMLRD